MSFRITLLELTRLLAMERATYATKSFIVALALVKKHLTVEQASLAATVEVSSQIERWGEVEDSTLTVVLSRIDHNLNTCDSSRRRLPGCQEAAGQCCVSPV